YRVYSISLNDTIGDLKKIVYLTGFSRIPVYENNKKSIKGLINVYDVFYSSKKDTDKLAGFLRAPVHVKETDGLDIALARLRHQKQPMGIVTNAANNVIGIITIEDILEEIVGDLEDK
ncbi:MAG: CBS domain-containing protein, partial [Candidatus Omnitrophica bacterium]|nr:CBS domain-containing protein [Candidatus Omnitrophota bacterium]